MANFMASPGWLDGHCLHSFPFLVIIVEKQTLSCQLPHDVALYLVP